MTITEGKPGTDADAPMIAELDQVFVQQREAFMHDTYPDAATRRERLGTLIGMVLANRDRIHDALREDFGTHPDALSDLAEIVTTVGRAQLAIEHLEEWMAPEPRETDPMVHGSASAMVVYQPKGVVGVISPWNFPFDLSLGPVADILASGNRAIVKPSEFTPACSALIREMVAATFSPDLVAVVTGGLDLARYFPTLRWDHLMYTGSTETGRAIARAAAENLTPLTLELGGKSPAIVFDDSVDAAAVANILGTKLLKNGQMCITPDYCFVPRPRVDDFVELAKDHYRTQLPDYASSSDCTGIISARHFERLERLLDEARTLECEVVPLGDDRADPHTRQMPLALVIDPPTSSGLMQEEIFGPILPVVPYDSVDEVIRFVNRGERPLGVYVFSRDETATQDVLDQTVSGGACVNACGWQGALSSLGFGGVGNSGFGRHHGIDGFRTFSNPRGVVVRGEGGVMDVFLPPYGELAAAVLGGIFGSAPEELA